MTEIADRLPVDPALVEEAEALTADAAAARHAELAEQIERANRLYHDEDAPEMTDAEYDQLFRAARRPRDGVSRRWSRPDSPTQRVGGALAGTFDEVRHRRPMLSLVERVQPRRAAGVRYARPARPRPAARPSRPPTCATSRSSRSTASRSRSATSAAGSSRARRAATARPART